MELKEYESKHLKVPYVFLKDKKLYICENGVAFTKEEYLKGIDLKAEYEKRSASGKLLDYQYVKKHGKLRYIKQEKPKAEGKTAKSVIVMCLALMITSFGSMYISTVHTATYLFDYTDTISAWLMSAVITVYCSTAFEVVLLFFDRKRYILSSVFAVLWLSVVLFSMATTVSIFYDRYNFTVMETQEVNRESEGLRLSLEMLQKKEKALSEAIEFKKKDIEYRQERDYATSAVRLELEKLQKELQDNLEAQNKVVMASPDAVKKEGEIKKKESLFAFLGRHLKVDGGILEFIMSTLSAVFINLISPLSVSVVVSFLGGMSKNERFQTRS